MRFILFFQAHWQNICSVSALLFGWFCYFYFEINSYNKSSQNKQIFAVALCLYKLRCSSNTSKWSLSCCPHSQKIRKSIKMLYFRCPGRPSQQHNSQNSQAFAEAALIKQGEAKIKGRAPQRYLSELPSTASSFPSHAFADNERTFLQLVPYHTTTFCRLSRENPVDKPLQKIKVHTTNCFNHTWMQRAQAMVYQHKYWKMLARKSKHHCQGITAAPQPDFAQDLSLGIICDNIFWWICTAGPPHLEGISHQQHRSSKTREPDCPGGHQEARLCTCRRQSLTAPL